MASDNAPELDETERMMDGKISIADAAKAGIQRVRLPNWANKLDHFKIDIIEGEPGPWLHLYAPFNQRCNGRDPVDLIWALGATRVDVHAPEFEIYTGPLPDSDEYKKATAAFAPR